MLHPHHPGPHWHTQERNSPGSPPPKAAGWGWDQPLQALLPSNFLPCTVAAAECGVLRTSQTQMPLAGNFLLAASPGKHTGLGVSEEKGRQSCCPEGASIPRFSHLGKRHFSNWRSLLSR